MKKFEGKYFFLSNFYKAPVEFEGIVYPSNENAFQAAKVHYNDNPDLTRMMRRNLHFDTLEPNDAKHTGKKVKLRPDWEMVKDDIMYQIVLNKFTRNEDLKQLLLDTNDEELIEYNYWHDNYWGSCVCSKCKNKQKGNTLGKILMQVRSELKN